MKIIKSIPFLFLSKQNKFFIEQKVTVNGKKIELGVNAELKEQYLEKHVALVCHFLSD